MNEESATQQSRRLAGQSALRKLRRLVDDEEALEHWRRQWIKGVAALAGLGGIAILLWFFH